MSDQPIKPRLTLSIKPKTAPTPTEPTTSKDDTPKPITRTGKRIVTRDMLPKAQAAIAPKNVPRKPSKPNKPKPKKPTNKRKPTPKPTPKKPLFSPSDLRARELNDSLNGFQVWRNREPLALGIERQVFQHIAKHSLSASKRVVEKLLRQHTHHKAYLHHLTKGGNRFNLDGTPAGEIYPDEQAHAAQLLASGKGAA